MNAKGCVQIQHTAYRWTQLSRIGFIFLKIDGFLKLKRLLKVTNDYLIFLNVLADNIVPFDYLE